MIESERSTGFPHINGVTIQHQSDFAQPLSLKRIRESLDDEEPMTGKRFHPPDCLSSYSTGSDDNSTALPYWADPQANFNNISPGDDSNTSITSNVYTNAGYNNSGYEYPLTIGQYNHPFPPNCSLTPPITPDCKASTTSFPFNDEVQLLPAPHPQPAFPRPQQQQGYPSGQLTPPVQQQHQPREDYLRQHEQLNQNNGSHVQTGVTTGAPVFHQTTDTTAVDQHQTNVVSVVQRHHLNQTPVSYPQTKVAPVSNNHSVAAPLSHNQTTATMSHSQSAVQVSMNYTAVPLSHNQPPAPVSHRHPAVPVSHNQPSVSHNQPSASVSHSQSASIVSQNQPAFIVSHNQPAFIVSHNQPAATVSHNQPAAIVSHNQPADQVSHNQPADQVSHNQPAGFVFHNQAASTVAHNQSVAPVSHNHLAAHVSHNKPDTHVSPVQPAAPMSNNQPAIPMSYNYTADPMSHNQPAILVSRNQPPVPVFRNNPPVPVSHNKPAAPVSHNQPVVSVSHSQPTAAPLTQNAYNAVSMSQPVIAGATFDGTSSIAVSQANENQKEEIDLCKYIVKPDTKALLTSSSQVADQTNQDKAVTPAAAPLAFLTNGQSVIIPYSSDSSSRQAAAKGSTAAHQTPPPPLEPVSKMTKLSAMEAEYLRERFYTDNVRQRVFNNLLEKSLGTVRRWRENGITMEVFYCAVCSIPTDSEDNLKSHLRKLHMGDVDEGEQQCRGCANQSQCQCQYKCRGCANLFPNNEETRSHERSCNIFRPYRCDRCDERFIFSSRLKFHRRTCGLGNLKCRICHRVYATKKEFDAHFLLHAFT